MTEYDPSVLQRFADSLYARAKWLELEYSFFGFAIGLAVFLVLGKLLPHTMSNKNNFLWTLTFLPVGLAAGLAVGRDKSFHLKLEAQQTLCQLQIEKNTRAAKKETET